MSLSRKVELILFSWHTKPNWTEGPWLVHHLFQFWVCLNSRTYLESVNGSHNPCFWQNAHTVVALAEPKAHKTCMWNLSIPCLTKATFSFINSVALTLKYRLFYKNGNCLIFGKCIGWTHSGGKSERRLIFAKAHTSETKGQIILRVMIMTILIQIAYSLNFVNNNLNLVCSIMRSFNH